MAQLTAPRSDFPRVWGHPEALPSEPPVPVGSQVHRASRRCVFPLSYLQLPPLSMATAICQSRGSIFSPVTFSLCPTRGAGRPSHVWGTDGVHTSAVPPTMHLHVLDAWACGGRGNTGQAVHPGGSFTVLLTCKGDTHPHGKTETKTRWEKKKRCHSRRALWAAAGCLRKTRYGVPPVRTPRGFAVTLGRTRASWREQRACG